MTRLIVRPAAEADILDARMWYSARNGAVADRFIDELRSTLSRVREMPRQFPDVGGARRALLGAWLFRLFHRCWQRSRPRHGATKLSPSSSNQRPESSCSSVTNRFAGVPRSSILNAAASWSSAPTKTFTVG